MSDFKHPVTHPVLYTKTGESLRVEARCAVCLRGLCYELVAWYSERRDIWALFVPVCRSCRRDIENGKYPIYRHNERQIAQVEQGDYEGIVLPPYKKVGFV